MAKFDNTYVEGRRYIGGFGGFKYEFADSCFWEGIGYVIDKSNREEYSFNFELLHNTDYEVRNNFPIDFKRAILNRYNLLRASSYNLIITPNTMLNIYDLLLEKIVKKLSKGNKRLDIVEIEGLTLADIINNHIFEGFKIDAKGHVYILLDKDFRL